MKAKILTAYNKLKEALSPYWKNLLKPLIEILLIIIICVLVARFMGGHETLLEYAEGR